MLAARGAHADDVLTARLLTDARVGALVLDTGFPDPATTLPADQLGVPTALLLRLELVLARAGRRGHDYDEPARGHPRRLKGLREKGFAGFKTSPATAPGSTSRAGPRADALASFAEARREVQATGAVRLGHKPLLDTLLHVAFEVAAAEELPVQFHVGYGDPDADLRSAHPLLLRDVLEEPGLPVDAGRAAARLLAVRPRGRLPGRGVRQRLPRPVVRHPVPQPAGAALDDPRRARRGATSS